MRETLQGVSLAGERDRRVLMKIIPFQMKRAATRDEQKRSLGDLKVGGV